MTNSIKRKLTIIKLITFKYDNNVLHTHRSIFSGQKERMFVSGEWMGLGSEVKGKEIAGKQLI